MAWEGRQTDVVNIKSLHQYTKLYLQSVPILDLQNRVVDNIKY